MCICVYSNSRNDVPRVAQRYETIAAHTRRRASVLVVFVVFCVHVYSFSGLIRRTPPPTFSDTAITDRHSDTTIFQLRAHWVRISWSVGSEKSFGHVPRWQSNAQLPACKASTLSTGPGSPLDHIIHFKIRFKPYRFYVRTVRGLVYRICDLVRKARFFSKQILPYKLF